MNSDVPRNSNLASELRRNVNDAEANRNKYYAIIWLCHHPELDRFSMEAELFREINGRFLPNELGDPTFLFHLFKENTTLHDIFKFEEFFVIQF